jgi:two-component sensor histidine kinase
LEALISLFSLQADRTSNTEVLKMLHTMQNRLRAVAKLHGQLFTLDDGSELHFGDYLRSLAGDLESFYNVQPRLKLRLNIADLALDAAEAFPLALISNELLANAFEHAFPLDRSGEISVLLRYLPPDNDSESPQGELTVTDNGVGLPKGFTLSEVNSVGLYSVQLLAKQLRGCVEVHTGRGTSFRVRFPLLTA